MMAPDQIDMMRMLIKMVREFPKSVPLPSPESFAQIIENLLGEVVRLQELVPPEQGTEVRLEGK